MGAWLCLACVSGCGRAPDEAREARDRHLRRATAAKERQDVDGAIEWCQKALDRNSNLALAHREMGLMLDNYREDYEMALYHYRRYLELRPDSPNRESVEELIRHCRVSIAAQVAESPVEWRRDLAARNDRIRNLEREVATLRAAVPAPSTAQAVTAPVRAPEAVRSRPSEAPATAASAPATTGRTHVVQSGDTLGTISSRYYGTPAKWNRIFEANRERISNANNVRVGTTLVIPQD